MTRRLTQLRVAAIAFGAVAAVSLTGPCAHAFTMETLSTNGGNTTRFADPADRSRNAGQGAQPFGQNGPTVQFNAGSGASGDGTLVRPFGGPRGGFYGPPQPLVGGNN